MIPVYQPFLNGNEKKYVNECLDTGWISSRGRFVGLFEQKFAEYIGTNHATTVSNGTVALHLALEILGITTEDEVIVPTLTYIASVNTILQTGAKVVYADSCMDTWNVDVNSIRKKITSKTKAIMVVHLYGLPCDMEAIVDLCNEFNLLLIEDCAEAFGSYYKEKHVGCFGDVATFSFFGNKSITTGEGGMVVCKTSDLLEKATHLKSQGVSKTKEYWHDTLAYNYRMTNIAAAIGLAQLEQADEILEKKRIINQWYAEALVNLPLSLHAEQVDTKHSFWMNSIILHDRDKRQELRDYLKCHGVETRPLFPPAHTMPHCYEREEYPNAEYLSYRGINLPSFPELTLDQVKCITTHICNFFI